ncbi:MAG: cation transporter dimerization domain-containing protein [Anaerolineae bacterium]
MATIIAINAVSLFRENLCFLLGRSPGPEYLAEIERLACSVPGVLGVHGLRAEYIGPEAVHADMHIEEADRTAEKVNEQIHQGLTPVTASSTWMQQNQRMCR